MPTEPLFRAGAVALRAVRPGPGAAPGGVWRPTAGLLPDSRAVCPRLASPPPPESPHGWEVSTLPPRAVTLVLRAGRLRSRSSL